MNTSASEVAAWLAVIGTAVTLFAQGFNILRKRRREKAEVSQALDQAPYVRQQLWLGNVGGAVEHLTRIVESQGRYIEQQDKRFDEQEQEYRKEMARLEAALEAERKLRRLLEAEIANLKRERKR